MGKFKQYDVTIGRTNLDGTLRVNTYHVSKETLATWIESWLNDKDAVTINIEGVEDA